MITLDSILAELPATSRLDASDRAKLAAIATLRECAPDERIYAEGEPVRSCALIASGRVAIRMRVPGQPDRTVITLGPGELIGWSALTDQTGYAAAAIAVERSHLVVLDREPLVTLCETDHDIGYVLMRLALDQVARRLHDTRVQLLDLYRSAR